MENSRDISGHSEVETLRLIDAARDVRLRAYAPYSKYNVGAAVLGEDNVIYGGCNVENASYGLCMCAERVALGAAVAGGCIRPAAIAIVTANAGSPCGACRQVMVELNPQMQVIIAAEAAGDGSGAGAVESYRVTTSAELLPDYFRLEK